MAKEIREIDFEFERNITSDKVAWYDINKFLMQLDQNDPNVTKLKGMLKYIDKCDVYLKLWDRKRNHDQANLQQQSDKRLSERLTTKLDEGPPVKIGRKAPEPTPIETSITKSPFTVEETAKIVDVVVPKRKWAYIFVKSRELDSLDCYEVKNAIVLSPGSLAVPCFIRECSGGLRLKLRDLPLLAFHFQYGKRSDAFQVKKMCELLIQDGELLKDADESRFFVTECRAHDCGIPSELIRDIKEAKKQLKIINRFRSMIAFNGQESNSYLTYVSEKIKKEKRSNEGADVIEIL